MIVYLNIYLTEECEIISDPTWNKKFTIKETLKVGEEIGKITIKNPGRVSCTPNEIKCSLNEDRTEVIVTLNEVVEHYPDRIPGSESKPDLNCRLRCSDDVLAFSVIIEDVNNNRPEFENSLYEFNVRELTPINSTLNSKPITVSDYDFDLQTNAKISVSITKGDTEMFKLENSNPSSFGKQNITIILKKRLNFKKKKKYKLTLTAKDHGEPQLSGTANVVLNILDDDDRDPEFEFFFYSIHLIIDKTEDGIVIRNNKTVEKILIGNSKKIQLNDIKPKEIHAFDPDLGINASIYYKLGKSDWTKYFEINKEDGSIFLISFNLSLLEEQKINLPIEAYQTDFEEKKGHACLTVFFDANVSRPYFIHQIDVLNKSLKNDIIYKVNAVGENLTYAVNDNQFVDINPTSGDIYLLQNATSLSQKFSANFIAKTKFSHVYNNFEGYFHIVQREYKEPLFKKSIYQIQVSKYSQKQDYLFEIGSEIFDKNIYLNLTGGDAQYFDIDYTVKERIWIILSESLPPERENFIVIVEAIKEVNRMVLERDSAKLIFEVIEGSCQLKIFEKNIYVIHKNPKWKVGDIIYTLKSNIPYTQFYIRDENKFFSVNITTGDIFLKTELDKCEKYELMVYGYAKDPRYDTIPPRNDTTQLIFFSDVCIKKYRKFSKCVYTWNIENFRKSEPPSINLKDREFTENVSFSIISSSNINDNFKIDEFGKLWMIKKLFAGQYFLKLQQENNVKYSRSNEIPKIEDVGNNEALIVVDIEKSTIKEEKKILFLHSNPLLKLFLPNAPLSDYNFEIKVFSSMDDNIKIKIKDESDSFAVDSETNQIFPIKDISKIERYHEVLTVKTDFSDKPKLDIYIYHVHAENCLILSLSTNSSMIFNKVQMERIMSSIFQNNSKEEITFHILKYSLKKSLNNFNNFEMIVTMLNNKTLLTFEEMSDKFKDHYIQQQIQNSFGSFPNEISRYEKLLKEINDDKNENTFFIPAIVFGSLTIFIIILLLILFIVFRFRKSKQNSQLIHNKFHHENIKSKEQEGENQSVNSLNNTDIVEERTNQPDEVHRLSINETNLANESKTCYYNKAYEILSEVNCSAENEVGDRNQFENHIKHNEDQVTLYDNIKNKNTNLNYVESEMKNKTSNDFENDQYNVEDNNENHNLHYIESETKNQSVNDFKSDEHNVDINSENNQNTKKSTVDLIITVDVNNGLSEDKNERNDDDDDDNDSEDEIECRNRTFSHRDSLTRLASFSEHVGNDSSDSDDQSYEQNPKRSLVTFNNITEYIP